MTEWDLGFSQDGSAVLREDCSGTGQNQGEQLGRYSNHFSWEMMVAWLGIGVVEVTRAAVYSGASRALNI